MKKIHKYALWAAFLLGGLAYYIVTGLPDGRLHVYFLDVGQGDATLVRTPDNQFILIDGGPNDAVIREISSVMPFYEKTIDLMILTHPHPDHVNGLVEVLKRYDVRRVLLTGIDYDYAGYTAFLEALTEERKGPLREVSYADGGDYRIGSVMLDVLHPFSSIQGRRFENVNNSSLVFRLIYGNTVIYFSGDCELECEGKIVASGQDLSADVLKIGHHGSRTSSSETLLDGVFKDNDGQSGPAVAVIQVGADNSFKHPHAETVKKLQERGVQIFRTDVNGRVELVSDGINYTYTGH